MRSNSKKIIKEFNKIDRILEKDVIAPIIVPHEVGKIIKDYVDESHRIKNNLRLILDEDT